MTSDNLADASGVTQGFYDQAGDHMAGITIDAILGLGDLVNDLQEFEAYINTQLEEYTSDPETFFEFWNGISGAGNDPLP